MKFEFDVLLNIILLIIINHIKELDFAISRVYSMLEMFTVRISKPYYTECLILYYIVLNVKFGKIISILIALIINMLRNFIFIY